MIFTGDWNHDNIIMESYLDKMDIISGTARNNLHYVNKKIGGSVLYGHTWKSYITPTRNRTPSYLFKNLSQTKVVDQHPEMINIFAEFANRYFPDFFYTQIQINKNYQVGKHKDGSNVGESVLCCFGDYEGGETVVDFGDAANYSPCKLDPRVKPVRFNGSKYDHWVEAFEGKRYSLVFFNNIKNWESKLIKKL